MSERNFSGRVTKNENGPGFIVETEMLFPTLAEANLFADWIQQTVKAKIASVGGVAVPNLIKASQ